jgi:hypothetical protein
LSTPSLQEVNAICDRAMILRNGRSCSMGARAARRNERLLFGTDAIGPVGAALRGIAEAGRVSGAADSAAGCRSRVWEATAASLRARRGEHSRLFGGAGAARSGDGFQGSQRRGRSRMNSAIKRIAAKEMSLFFSSPIGYLFLAVFLAITLFVFFWGEAFFARNIADVRPMFEWLPLLLLFLCSALTMRMWSEERRSGTLEFVDGAVTTGRSCSASSPRAGCARVGPCR